MDIVVIISIIVGSIIIGGGISWLFLKNKIHHDQRQSDIQKQFIELLTDKFKALSADALSKNNQDFLRLAEQSFKNLHTQSDSNLKERQKAIEHLLEPVREALKKTENQIRTIEQERKQSYGSLAKHIELTGVAQQELRRETSKLVQALKQPQVRGRWGEMTLHRLVELAGMVEYCDFNEQVQAIGADDQKLRPDMTIHLPNSRIIVIDAKTPLHAYLEAFETDDENIRREAMIKHTQNVTTQIKKLSEKSYWQAFDNALDFVVLFMPGDQFLAAALKQKPDLIETAMKDRVILATPTSLVGLLRVIAFGWQEKTLAENALEIQKLGRELCERIDKFNQYFTEVGQHLERSVKKYNEASSSWDSRLLSSVRKFTELGIQETKKPPEASYIETNVSYTNKDETK